MTLSNDSIYSIYEYAYTNDLEANVINPSDAALAFINKRSYEFLYQHLFHYIPKEITLDRSSTCFREKSQQEDQAYFEKALEFSKYIQKLSIINCELLSSYSEMYLNRLKDIKTLNIENCKASIALFYRFISRNKIHHIKLNNSNFLCIRNRKCKVISYQRIKILRDKNYIKKDALAYLFHLVKGNKIKSLSLEKMCLSQKSIQNIAKLKGLRSLEIVESISFHLDWLSTCYKDMNLFHLKISIREFDLGTILFFLDELIKKPINSLDIEFLSVPEMQNLDFELLQDLYIYLLMSAKRIYYFNSEFDNEVFGATFDEDSLIQLKALNFVCEVLVLDSPLLNPINVQKLVDHTSLKHLVLNNQKFEFSLEDIQNFFSIGLVSLELVGMNILKDISFETEINILNLALKDCINFNLKSLFNAFKYLGMLQSLEIETEFNFSKDQFSALIAEIVINSMPCFNELTLRLTSIELTSVEVSSVASIWKDYVVVEYSQVKSSLKIKKKSNQQNFRFPEMRWENTDKKSVNIDCSGIPLIDLECLFFLLGRVNLNAISISNLSKGSSWLSNEYSLAKIYHLLFNLADSVSLHNCTFNFGAIESWYANVNKECNEECEYKCKDLKVNCNRLVELNLNEIINIVKPFEMELRSRSWQTLNRSLITGSNTISYYEEDREHLKAILLSEVVDIKLFDIDFSMTNLQTNIPNITLVTTKDFQTIDLISLFKPDSQLQNLKVIFLRDFQLSLVEELFNKVDQFFKCQAYESLQSLEIIFRAINKQEYIDIQDCQRFKMENCQYFIREPIEDTSCEVSIYFFRDV